MGRNDERDGEIAELYSTGELTLEDLAERYTLSPARIGQIAQQRGHSREKAGVLRRGRKASALNDAVSRLEEKFQAFLPTLAEEGLTRQEILDRLAVFMPAEQPETIAAAVERSRKQLKLVFNKSKTAPSMPDSVVEASLLYLAGMNHELVGDPDVAVVALSQEAVAGVADELRKAGVAPTVIPSVLGAIHATREALGSGAALTLSKKRYDGLREEFLTVHGIESEKGLATWPVGGLTVSNRLGGSWNSALTSVGMFTSAVPPGFGAAHYGDDEYQAAIRDFQVQSRLDDTDEGYSDYEEWVRSEKSAGRTRPSGPSVRNAFPSWNEAIRSNGDRGKIDRVTERRRRSADESLGASKQLIEAKQDEYDRLGSELATGTQNGTLSPSDAESLKEQQVLAAAQIAHYKGEDERWEQQKIRWEESDEQAGRQFHINLVLAISVGVGSLLVPIVVWTLETFGPGAG